MSTTSGVTEYDPTLNDSVIAALNRLQIRGASITADHLISSRRALNNLFVRWANKGINWFSTDLQVIPLEQGVAVYDVPSDTVSLLPYSIVIRNYQLGAPTDLVPGFETSLSSTSVTINLPNHGFSVGWWTNVIVPVSIGGIVVLGYYQVASVTGINSYTITAPSAAASAEVGGAVPNYATIQNTVLVQVAFDNHGQVPGDTWNVAIQTNVGGLQLLGDYTITTVIDANTFTFDAPYAAGYSDSAFENSGSTEIAGQTASTNPVDRIITALSNVDYASISQKATQAPPTSFFYNRQINPTITMWPVPDGSGPYELRYWRMRQIQTATPRGTQTADIPYRFIEALISGLAYFLAMEWKPEVAKDLMAYADMMFEEAAVQDREQGVIVRVSPNLSGYYQ